MPSIFMSAAFVFIVGAIFWAGATYQRIGSIEARLTHIDEQLAKIADIPTLIERSANNQRRIEDLEATVKQLMLRQT